VIAGQGCDQQPRELLTDGLAQAQRGGRRQRLLVEASALLEDAGKSAGLRLGGVHAPCIGADPPPGNPSPE